MKLIVACDKEYSIGKDGELLTYLPKDLKRFKSITMGNIMIMGRKPLIPFREGGCYLSVKRGY